MNDTNTGGPAFPLHADERNLTRYGMTLRDYFAAKAMQAFISATRTQLIESDISLITKSSYILADTMLKARDQQ